MAGWLALLFSPCGQRLGAMTAEGIAGPGVVWVGGANACMPAWLHFDRQQACRKASTAIQLHSGLSHWPCGSEGMMRALLHRPPPS